MAGRRNPTFLKRQKEQRRMERASAKRAARMARRADKATAAEESAPDYETEVPAQDEPESPAG